jgi:hypothetical protein
VDPDTESEEAPMSEAPHGAAAGDPLEAWVRGDDALRARAHLLAAKLGRDEEGVYRTLKHFQRSASERLRLGLRHGRLHPDHR